MPLRILALEPYYGGSHQAFLDGWQRHSRHRIEPVTMPARKWKWRMRGAAVTMSREVREHAGAFDLVFASDFVDLACLVALAGDGLRGVPRVAYFHENQITYPLPDESERDYQYGFTNITSCLAADRVLFNSRYHMESFLAGAADLLGRMPDFVPDWAPDAIRERSDVVPVGVDLADVDAQRPHAEARAGPLSILWNHRWEYDKGAEDFVRVVERLQEAGYDFRLSVLGQAFRAVPAVFDEAAGRLRGRIRTFGYLPSRADYCRELLRCDVVVSTALHEFFGVSVVEAAYAGCLPLLPNRLSYPELVPEGLRATCLYADADDLAARLARYCERPEEARAADAARGMERFGWPQVAPQLDAVADEAVAGGGR